MGREIRRVPETWEHPKDEDGYLPMFDKDYDTACQEWIEEFNLWQKGEHPDQKQYNDTSKYYWDWDGMPPNCDYYREPFSDEPTHYQIYETVSEGTPVSPVFETLDELANWLIKQGYSQQAARNFAKGGWAPSMIVGGGRVLRDIEACAEFPDE